MILTSSVKASFKQQNVFIMQKSQANESFKAPFFQQAPFLLFLWKQWNQLWSSNMLRDYESTIAFVHLTSLWHCGARSYKTRDSCRAHTEDLL